MKSILMMTVIANINGVGRKAKKEGEWPELSYTKNSEINMTR